MINEILNLFRHPRTLGCTWGAYYDKILGVLKSFLNFSLKFATRKFGFITEYGIYLFRQCRIIFAQSNRESV